MGNIKTEEFADLFAQTITYGLFASRSRSPEGFNRKIAYDQIPPTLGILRDMFRFISFKELLEQMEWIVDDISEVLAITDVKRLFDEYFQNHKGNDPILHFYETFLMNMTLKQGKKGEFIIPLSLWYHTLCGQLMNCLKRNLV